MSLNRRIERTCLVLLCILTVAVVGCGLLTTLEASGTKGVDYNALRTNRYAVEVTQTKEYTLYLPEAEGVTWGFLFYVGTMLPPENYDALFRAVAGAGFAVGVSKNALADLMYREEEPIYAALGLQRYIIAGHSQGGGAAIRRAAENPATTKGCVLYSPMIVNDATLAGSALPTLYFEAENDTVLSDAIKAVAKSRMNAGCRYALLEGANHMCYGEMEFFGDGVNDRDKAEIQQEVIDRTIAFLQSVTGD